jgi:ATP-dependent DNA helicase DinG
MKDLGPSMGRGPTDGAAPPGSEGRLVDAVARVFDDDGPLARALEGFEPRPGQRDMAQAVADSFERGVDLLAEAGTGTGKTLAYLVPAILCGHRVLISTGTKNLQEQIYFKDIPILRRALDVPFEATYMKGRGNYLCLHRLDSLRRDPAAGPFDRRQLAVLERWAAATETGDRAEVEELPEDDPLWADLTSTSDTCLGSDCPRYQECFITRMRQRAAESDLVIVNHHLLCADAAVRQGEYGEVIPACTFAVLDEAHQVEDVATQYFGRVVSTYRVEDLSRDADRLIGMHLVQDEDGTLRRAVDRLQDDARAFFVALQYCRQAIGEPAGGLAGGYDSVRIRPGMLAEAVDPGQDLTGALENLQATIALMRAAPEDAATVARRAIEIRDELAFLLRADEPDFVFFLEIRGRGVFLRAAPIDVSAIVREFLLDRMQATILTSATLSIGGSFDYIRSRLGVTTPRELLVPSEFDYARQAILYLPQRMPDPRSAAFAESAGREILEVVKRTEGRAFVLFTSYAVLRTVEAIAEAALGFPLLVQGSAPRSTLLQQFRTTPNAVLLATSSFWQGVDVVGEALSCVIVDKLPFASPADPITAARMEAIAEEGGDPFNEYQVPLAILSLQQGLGRLIRHRRDRGVLAILDPRLRTKGYGRRFLEALPPAPITSDLDEISRFFAA